MEKSKIVLKGGFTIEVEGNADEVWQTISDARKAGLISGPKDHVTFNSAKNGRPVHVDPDEVAGVIDESGVDVAD